VQSSCDSVTNSVTLPALLVGHDRLADAAVARVQDVIEGAGLQIVTRFSTDDTFDAGDLTPALRETGADDPFPIVHIVGPIEDPSLTTVDRGPDPTQALVDSIRGVQNSIADRFPGKRRLDLWVIHTVGQVIDDVEHEFIAALAATFSDGLKGIVVSASTTKSSVVHDDDEQAGFAADLGLLIVGSDMGRQLGDSGIIAWVAGANSVRYSRRDLARRLAAERGIVVLNGNLLAPPRASDPSFKSGQSWVEKLDLLNNTERLRLLDSGAGGTLLQRVHLGGIEWDKVPVTSWVDALTTNQTVRALTQLDDIDRVIDLSATERIEGLKRSLVAHTQDMIVSTERIEAALATAAGARVNLEQLVDQLEDAASSVDPDSVAADRAKLRRMSRWLPFGPAVALRTFAFATAVLLFVASITDRVGWGALSRVGEPWGRFAGIATLVVCYVLYQRRIAGMLRVRDRLAATLERQLAELVEAKVVAARRRILTELCEWIGQRPSWLDDDTPSERPDVAPDLSAWFAWVIVELRQASVILANTSGAADDSSHVRPALSRYVLDLPVNPATQGGLRSNGGESPSIDVTVKELVSQLPQAYDVGLGLSEVSGLDSVVIDLLAGTTTESSLDGELASLLRADDTSRKAARRVLEFDTTPVVGVDNAGDGESLRHFLAIEGGTEGSAYRTLFVDESAPDGGTHRVSSMLGKVIDVGIPGLAVMGHFYSLDSLATGISDARTEDPT